MYATTAPQPVFQPLGPAARRALIVLSLGLLAVVAVSTLANAGSCAGEALTVASIELPEAPAPA